MKKKGSISNKLNSEDFLLYYGELCRKGEIDALLQLGPTHPETAASC